MHNAERVKVEQHVYTHRAVRVVEISMKQKAAYTASGTRSSHMNDTKICTYIKRYA